MATCPRLPVESGLCLKMNASVLLFLLPLCGCNDITSLEKQVESLQMRTLQLEKELMASHAFRNEITQSWKKHKKRLSDLEERVQTLDGEVVSDSPYAFLMNNAEGRVDELEERIEWIEARLQ